MINNKTTTKEIMKEKGMTINQHFIPCTYLSEFSSNRNDVNCRKSLIFYYNCEKRVPSIFNGVAIDSIKYLSEPYLYELETDNVNEIIYPNKIENHLGCYEQAYHKYVSKLKSKVNSSNYKIKCFLNQDEKRFWKHWITIWWLRIHFVDNELFDPENEEELTGMGVGTALSGLCALGMDDKFVSDFFDTEWPQIWNLSLCFFYDEQANIITSDNPMYYEYENEKISFILFPVSSELVLMMYKSEHGHRNILRPITDSQRKLIFEIMVKQAKQMIFLKRSINKQEIKLANKILDENKLSSL